MSRSRVVLVVLFFAALLVPTAPAQASYSVLCSGYTSCTSKGYSSSGYSTHKGTSYWAMYTGTNCTNYVAYRLVTTNGLPNKRPKPGVGNAQDWGKAMASVTDTTPTVGSVAWWGRTGHHVAYVEKVVSSTEILVSESNWSGAFDWRRITKTGSGWPDGFIHFSDLSVKNTTKPTLGGTPTVGVPLSPSAGKWSATGVTYAYQWTADGTTISGATAKTFTPTPAVVNKKLAITVTASRTGYTSGQATSASAAVKPGSISAGGPSISGTGRVDEPLTASPGSWAPSATALAYQWSVAGTPVADATTSTFTPRPADSGLPVTVTVTGTLAGYATASTSPASAVTVSPGVVRSTSTPTITGTPAVGATLTARPGSWSASGLTYGYQWFVDDEPVPGATGPTYVPAVADRAKPVSLRVTASGRGYVTSTATTSPTAKVGYGTISAPAPAVTGSPRLGSWVRVAVGTPPVAGAVSKIQWLRAGVVVPGGTNTGYKITKTDLGKKLTVRVTWTAAGYTGRTVSTTTGAAKATAALTVAAKPGTRTVR